MAEIFESMISQAILLYARLGHVPVKINAFIHAYVRHSKCKLEEAR
jgi:hypothetical protein